MKVKQLVFIFIGLALIGTGLFFGRMHLADASLKEGQKFDDWKVACVKGQDKSKKTICYLGQEVTITKDDKPQVLAMYQIGHFQDDKKLRMIQILPLGIALQPGTSLMIGEKLIAPGKFTTCTAVGCNAVAEISNEDFEAILSVEKPALIFMNLEGTQVSLPISSKGLKEGIEALGK